MKYLSHILLFIYKNLIERDFSYGHEKVKIMASSFVSKDSSIGEYTFIGHNTFITKTTIGRYCSIANAVAIGQGEHPLEKISNSSMFYENPYDTLVAKECTIGNDVWIAHGSIIRRGVSVGDGAVIGANSYINRDVPPFAIVVGSPGKIIGYKFDENLRKKIIDSKWWNLQPTEAKKLISKLQENAPNFNRQKR